MRSFGRQCRGQGRVFVKLVRQTERQLLELGQPIPVLGRQAQQLLEETETLPAVQRERLTRQLRSALAAQAQIRKQSGRLTQGKKLGHCKLVNAYDLTIAPILKGKSNCPAQFGRKPGLMSEPATGFIFATRVPAGNPYDASYVVPLLDQVQRAIDRVGARKRRQVHSVAGDLGINDATVRQTLHERGILTIGIPQTVAPIDPKPTAEAIRSILTDAGLTQKRTPAQVQIACACGYSRPVVESHIASLLARGAGQVRYQGLAGAVVQQGMTVMAHNGATLARLPYQRLSKRAHKLRRLLRLKSPNPLENQEGKIVTTTYPLRRTRASAARGCAAGSSSSAISGPCRPRITASAWRRARAAGTKSVSGPMSGCGSGPRNPWPYIGCGSIKRMGPAAISARCG